MNLIEYNFAHKSPKPDINIKPKDIQVRSSECQANPGVVKKEEEVLVKYKLLPKDKASDTSIYECRKEGAFEEIAFKSQRSLARISTPRQEAILSAVKIQPLSLYFISFFTIISLSLIHICRCRRYAVCRSRWSPYH
eukprot:TRINITY_DN2420_c0_g1_i14.p2 TRINITY_DN2420_c0_g1~~TRINITY_DN2420_c0_g1_i14.p2  ORF type:complete len:137 (-),score=6.14 TRINITY_DN2420_c0_g1_i14:22-432(-)